MSIIKAAKIRAKHKEKFFTQKVKADNIENIEGRILFWERKLKEDKQNNWLFFKSKYQKRIEAEIDYLEKELKFSVNNIYESGEDVTFSEPESISENENESDARIKHPGEKEKMMEFWNQDENRERLMIEHERQGAVKDYNVEGIARDIKRELSLNSSTDNIKDHLDLRSL